MDPRYVIDRVVREPPAATHGHASVCRIAARNHFLDAQREVRRRRSGSVGDEICALDGGSGCESPARAARSLVADGRDVTLRHPIDSGADSGADSNRALGLRLDSHRSHEV